MKELDRIITLSAEELKKFNLFIKGHRKKLISPPKETAKKATESHKNYIDSLIQSGQISNVVTELRQLAYEQFLVEESQFNGVILGEIGTKFNTPKKFLEAISTTLYSMRN